MGGLQQELCGLLDEQRAEEFRATHTRRHNWSDLRRLRELQGPSVSHDWLWAFNPAHGATVAAGDFGIALRIRLGAFLTDEPTLCARCGKEILERNAAHALCCAAPEGTHGHYEARDKVFNLVQLADNTATTEVPELIPSAPALRPADIYTDGALPGTKAALDIGICSPDATNAGLDCCESMWDRKRARYEEYFEEMAANNLRYVPVVLSCYGRLHPEAADTLERIALQAGRRLGISNHKALLRRATAAVGVTVVTRAVAMARACLPRLGEEALQLFFGEGPDGIGAEEGGAQNDAGN